MKSVQMMIPVSLTVLVLGYMSMFSVSQHQKAIKFQLGEIVDIDLEPGLHFIMPFINNVRTFDGRVLTLNATSERFLTSEKKNVIVDSYAKWRVKNVGLY